MSPIPPTVQFNLKGRGSSVPYCRGFRRLSRPAAAPIAENYMTMALRAPKLELQPRTGQISIRSPHPTPQLTRNMNPNGKSRFRFQSKAGLPGLTEGKLKITPPNEFNDPFELSPGIVIDGLSKDDLRKSFSFVPGAVTRSIRSSASRMSRPTGTGSNVLSLRLPIYGENIWTRCAMRRPCNLRNLRNLEFLGLS